MYLYYRQFRDIPADRLRELNTNFPGLHEAVVNPNHPSHQTLHYLYAIVLATERVILEFERHPNLRNATDDFKAFTHPEVHQIKYCWNASDRETIHLILMDGWID